MKYDIYVTRSHGNFTTWVCERVGTDSVIVSSYSQQSWCLRDRDAMSGSVFKQILKQEAEIISHCEHEINL